MNPNDDLTAVMNDMNRIDKVILYVLGRLDNLVSRGLVERDDGAPELTAHGTKVYQQLLADGFTPTKDEIALAVGFFKREEGRSAALEEERSRAIPDGQE